MQTLFSHLESNGSHQAVGMYMSMTMTNTAGGFLKIFIALITAIHPASFTGNFTGINYCS